MRVKISHIEALPSNILKHTVCLKFAFPFHLHMFMKLQTYEFYEWNEHWKVCTCNFHLQSLVSVSFQFFWLSLNVWLFGKTFLLYNQGLQYYYLHQMLGVSDLDITFCPGNWDARGWERGRMHLLIKDDTNCLLTFQSGERSSKKLLGYFWQLFRSRRWTLLRRKRVSQVVGQLFFPLLSSLPVFPAADRLTGTQTCSTNDWSSTFCHQNIKQAIDSCWQILSNPVVVIYMLAEGLLLVSLSSFQSSSFS